MERKVWLAGLLVTVWALFTVAAFWWFQFRNIQQFSPLTDTEQSVYFQSTGLAEQLSRISDVMGESAERPQATVFHFWDQSCPCSRFNSAHVRDLAEQYSAKGVRFVVVPRAEEVTDRSELEYKAVTSFGSTISLATIQGLSLPSSPAAAVVGSDGKLAYFGPYSVGASCGAANGAFVEKTLDQILAGEHPRNLNMAAVGCFCDWNLRSWSNVI